MTVLLTTHKVVVDANSPGHARQIAAILTNHGYRVRVEIHELVERDGIVTEHREPANSHSEPRR